MLPIHSQSAWKRTPWSSNILLCIFIWLATIRSTSAADKTAADYFITSLPGQPDGPLLRQHAGHIEIDHHNNANLFFWFYHNRHLADRPRTVIWLNGGPGCSSEDGALMEIGPYRVQDDGKLRYNDGSWDQFANLLFVDNPVGTGFSYVNGDSYLHELPEMADHFILFLEKWFSIFPEYETDDLYIAGESYAGQHIPYIAQAIQKRNKDNPSRKQWDLKGLLIGNGWIAPATQYLAYLPAAYEAGLIQGGSEQAQRVEKQLSECMKALGKPGSDEKVNINVCEDVLNSIMIESQKDGRCPNMYDMRLTDTYPSCGMNWPPDLASVTPYLQRKDVTDALHINPEKRTGWAECSGTVSMNFRASKSKASIKLIPDLLESGLPIVLFSGANDLICTHIGTEDLIAKMKWNGATGFGNTPQQNWTFEGEEAGYYQEARNLTYVLFHESSHMVPFDWPRRSLHMLNTFMGVDSGGLRITLPDSDLDGGKSDADKDKDKTPSAHPNDNTVEEEHKKKLHEATLRAYYRSGEAALVVVIIGAAIFGIWVWRGRRRSGDKEGLGAYMSIPGSGVAERFRDNMNGHASGGSKSRDLEAGDFDENELDTLPASRGPGGTDTRDLAVENSPYDLASDSDDDDDDTHKVKEGRR